VIDGCAQQPTSRFMAGPSLETLRWAGTRPAPVTVEQTVCAMDDDESGTVLLNVGHRATGPL
jgi:hypothetical protein